MVQVKENIREKKVYMQVRRGHCILCIHWRVTDVGFTA